MHGVFSLVPGVLEGDLVFLVTGLVLGMVAALGRKRR